MANSHLTDPSQSFTYIGSFAVETEDEDDVHSIPPSPINVGTDEHNDDMDTPADDENFGYSHDDSINSVCDDGSTSLRCIDHTALLLGDEYEEDAEDDEREWNVSFSLDELERSNDHHVGKGIDQEKEEQLCVISGDENNDSKYCQVSGPTPTITNTDPARHQQYFQLQSKHQQVLHHASSLPTPVYSKPHSTQYTIPKRQYKPSHTSTHPNMLQNDAWRREEEEQQAYSNMPRKKINTFENKKKMATMKALAMKERASSALLSRATRAKDKLKEKMTISAKQVVQDIQNQKPSPIKRSVIHGIEQPTLDHDSHTQTTSSASSEVSPVSMTSSLSLLSNFTPAYVSKSKSSIGTLDSHSSRDGQTKTSSLSQKAHRAMSLVLTAAVSSTSSSTSSASSSSSSMNPRRLNDDKKSVAKQQINDTVFSIDDEDNMSDIPSVLNSEGPNSIQDVSCDGFSSITGVRSVGRNNMINKDAYSTPKIKRNTRKKTRSEIADCSNLDESGTANLISPNHIYSPEQILANLSLIAKQNVTSTEASCSSIDDEGFLVSQSSATIHRRMSDSGSDDAPSTSLSQAAALPTVGSTISSEGGTFDPNSFLFLSPLSDHDVDDPDHGMPFLLSRSNSHNAVVMDRTQIHPPPPHGAPNNPMSDNNRSSLINSSSSPSHAMSNSKRLSIRFPSSPRIMSSPKLLPPSGKKNTKKKTNEMSGAGDSSGCFVKQGHDSLDNNNCRLPLLMKNRAQTSSF